MYRLFKAHLWLFFAAFLVLGMSVVIPGIDGTQAIAQEEEDKDAPMKGKQSATLSKRVYELISEANEKVDAEDYAGARELLDKVKAMPKLSTYETAQMYSFYGFLYFNSEQFAKAREAYEQVLKQPDLPEGLVQQTYRTLAQLAFATEDYQQAIKYANDYMAQTGPDAEMYVIIGTAYYQLAADKGDRATKDDFRKIISPVETAIKMSEEKGNSGKEQWWLLLRVAYWELDDYKKVKEILEMLVVNWPKKEYWTQLSGIYFELKDEPRQLAAYEAAYDQGLLNKSAELVQMSQLHIQAEAPYKGARVLEKGFEAGIVERNVRNLRLMSQAWQLAAEDQKAIGPLEEAAGMSEDGELYARLAQSHLNLSQFKPCIGASNKALQKGKLKNTGNAYLILGMCQTELGQLAEAKTTFGKAAQYDKVAKNATSWINYVSSEQSRLEQLERSLKEAQEYLDSLKEYSDQA
jgi:tetratricopeptide (TPR) repeat protein